MSELNLILLGPPGAGKGTQAARLREDFDLPYIATGDLLRRHKSEQTELGREAKSYMEAGKLVPDELVIAMILDCVERRGEDGFLLDGFPRTIPQADALAEALDERGRRLTAALLVEAPDDVVVKRLSGRRQCSSGHLYHEEFDPPKHEGQLRPVRQAAVPARRRRSRQGPHPAGDLPRETEPLIDYYEERGLLRRFDGTRSPGEVHDHIRATLATLRLEERL